MDLIKELRKKTKEKFPVVVLPEIDERVSQAALELDKKKIARIVVLVPKEKDRKRYRRKGLILKHGLILPFLESPQIPRYAKFLYRKRKKKGLSLKEAYKWLKDPNAFAYCMLSQNSADLVVTGNISTTAHVARRSFQIVGVDKGYKHAHGAYIINLKDELFVCADVAIEMRPDGKYLAETAVQTARFVKDLGIKPKVAFLSYSTHGSAKSEDVDKIRKALKIAKRRCPRVSMDGELQFDAATDPRVSKIKSPKSKIKGDANILIFPDLASGNIGCKILGEYGKGRLIGPLLVGLKKPVSDLSRGCKPRDIVDTVTCLGSVVKNPTSIDTVCFKHSIPHP